MTVFAPDFRLSPSPFGLVCGLWFRPIASLTDLILAQPFGLFAPVYFSLSTLAFPDFDYWLALCALSSDSGKLLRLQLDSILPSERHLLFCFLIFPLLFLKVILGGDLLSVGSWLHARFEPGKPSKTSWGIQLDLVRQLGPELLFSEQFCSPSLFHG